MELPSDWTPNLQGEQGGYSWRSPNADLELLVNVMENDGDPVNPFDISEDEADELLAPSRAASAQELEVGFQAQGLSVRSARSAVPAPKPSGTASPFCGRTPPIPFIFRRRTVRSPSICVCVS